MTEILRPGYLRWNGVQYITVPDSEVLGPTGSTGPVGPVGGVGGIGPQGPQGDRGLQGLTGATGATGAAGGGGGMGPMGPTGATGPNTITIAGYALQSSLQFTGSGYSGASSVGGVTTITVTGGGGSGGGPAGATGATGATGPNGATGATGPPGAAGTSSILECGLRMCIYTNPTYDIDASASLYFIPYKHSYIPLPRNGNYDNLTVYDAGITGFSLALPATTPDKLYDVGLVYSSPNPAIVLSAWTDNYTRSPSFQLVYHNGLLYINEGGLGYALYMGTIRTPSSGVVCDTPQKRFIYNHYNKIPRVLGLNFPANWTPAHGANNFYPYMGTTPTDYNDNNSVYFVCGELGYSSYQITSTYSCMGTLNGVTGAASCKHTFNGSALDNSASGGITFNQGQTPSYLSVGIATCTNFLELQYLGYNVITSTVATDNNVAFISDVTNSNSYMRGFIYI